MQKISPLQPGGIPVLGRSRMFFFLIVALIYGFFLSQLPDVQYKDFNNYLIVAQSSSLIALQNVDYGLLRFLSNEPVWLLINTGLGLFLDPEAVVRIIIFLSASSLALLILRSYPRYFIWLILFMFLPQVIKNYLVHLRQGAAVAVFLWGWFSERRSTRYLLIGLTPLIHASFFFILFLLMLASALKLVRFASHLKIVTYVASGVFFSFGLSQLAEIVGARQAEEYDFERFSVSGLGFFLWSVLLGILLLADKKWQRNYIFEMGIVCFYLATYWQIAVAARIFESGLIIVLLSGLTLNGWQRSAFLTVVLGAGVFAWFLQAGQPSFGFADY